MANKALGRKESHPPSDYISAVKQIQRLTRKYLGYAVIYDQIIIDFQARAFSNPTIVEIGVAAGGGLETWRRLFPGARIIGVDLSEAPKAMEIDGYEILTLDMGKEESWQELKAHLGESADLIVDDGGHTNVQQLSALAHGIELLSEGGYLVIEDLHASFLPNYYNPSRYSTWSFLQKLSDDLQRSHSVVPSNPDQGSLAFLIDLTLQGPSIFGLRRKNEATNLSENLVGGLDNSLFVRDYKFDDRVKLPRWIPVFFKDKIHSIESRVRSMRKSRAFFKK